MSGRRTIRAGVGIGVLAALVVAVPASLRAQAALVAPRVELVVLASAATGGDLATAGATGRSNSVPTGGPVPYFDTDARVSGSLGGEARLTVRAWRRWFAEAGIAYARPSLEVRLDNDVEQATPVTAASRLTQVVVDGALVRRLAGPQARVTPFVMGGAGYLRQLDEPRTTVGTGQVYFGGAGVLLRWSRPRPGSQPRLALRGDVRLVAYRGGLPLVDERPVGVVAALGLSLRVR